MIFPLRVFGSASVKRMSSGLAMGPISLPDVRAESFLQARPVDDSGLERDKRDHRLALQFIRSSYHGRLGDVVMADQRALHLGRTEAMSRDVEHVVDAARRSRNSRPCRGARRLRRSSSL